MTDCGAILVMKEEVGAKQVGTNTATAHMEPREQDTNTSPPLSGHAATIELSPWQKLDVTNQICALRRSHLLSWSTTMSQHV